MSHHINLYFFCSILCTLWGIYVTMCEKGVEYKNTQAPQKNKLFKYSSSTGDLL